MAATKFPCPECDKTFSRKADVSRHVDNMHRQVRGFQCRHPGCGRSFPQKSHEKQHYAAIHDKGGPQHRCKGCGRLFNDPSSRKRHQKSLTACIRTAAPGPDTAAHDLQRPDPTNERQPPPLPSIPPPAVGAADVGFPAHGNAGLEFPDLAPTDINPWFLEPPAENLEFPFWAGSSHVDAPAALDPLPPQLATPPSSGHAGVNVDGNFEFDFGFDFDQFLASSVHQDRPANVGLQLPAPFALEDVPDFDGDLQLPASFALEDMPDYDAGLQLPAPFTLEDVSRYEGANWVDAAIADAVR